MLKMKKLFSVILSFMLCSMPFCSMAYAITPEDNVGMFVGRIIPSYEKQFVFDLANRDRLTEELDKRLPRGSSLLDYMKLYHDEIQNILDRGGEDKYNCRALSAWVWYELRSHTPAVECKELVIASRQENGDFSAHGAVLIPYNESGVKKWFVCDLSNLSQFHNPAFSFVELKDYISAYGDLFMGMIVCNNEYTSWNFLTGYGNCGGRDIAAWLATDAGDTKSALEVLRSQKTPKIKVMSSADTLESDTIIVDKLISFSPELQAKRNNHGVDFVVG